MSLIKPIDVDEGEDDNLMWDTALAIDKVIQDVTILFQFLFPQIEEDAISFIGGIVKMAYEEVGINQMIMGSINHLRVILENNIRHLKPSMLAY